MANVPLRYTPEEIQQKIEELRLTPGVTIERIEDRSAFDIVIVWGEHIQENGVATGAIAIYRKIS